MKRFLLVMIICCAGADAPAQQGTLLISELLYQPLSGEAEFVELYNHSSNPVDLADYHIVRWLGDSMSTHYPLPTYTLPAHSYVVLTKNVASVTACYRVEQASTLLECNLPPYPNDGGSVILSTTDSTVVDRFDYLPSMHSRLLRNKAGVSLERRSFDRPTNEASNWFSASSISGYGTPGYTNSQSTEWLAEETSFEFSSTLLSPDGDGYQDELTITYRIDNGDLAARAEIYTPHGLIVRRLLNNELLGTHGSFVWDGRGEDGAQLPQGQYIVQILLFDPDGTRQTLRRVIALIAS